MVPKKYMSLGFEISKFGAGSFALRHNNKPIFVFGSESEIRDDFVSVICDHHLKKTQRKIFKKDSLDAG